MDIVGTLIRVHGLEVDCMPQNVIFLSNPIPSDHLSCISRNLDGLHAVVPFQHRNHFNGQLALLQQSGHLQDTKSAQGNIDTHLG